MALRHAVLATLLDADASGYELAKRFDASVANFWHALPQQIYGELRHLEQQGLIRGRTVRQRGRPDKRVFTITKAGQQALRDFAAAPTKPGAVKEDLAVKVYAAAIADPEALIAALNQRAVQSAAKLERYRRQADALSDPTGRTSAPASPLRAASPTSARTSAGVRLPLSACDDMPATATNPRPLPHDLPNLPSRLSPHRPPARAGGCSDGSGSQITGGASGLHAWWFVNAGLRRIERRTRSLSVWVVGGPEQE